MMPRFCIGNLALISLVCALATPSLPADETIVLQGDVWPPYVMDPAEGRNGFMIDVAVEALKGTKFRITYENMPWTRALDNADKGLIAGVVGIFEEDAAAHAYTIPAEELGISETHIYTRQDFTWQYTDISSLEGIVLATVQSYNYGEITAYVNAQAAARSPAVIVMSGDKALEKNIAMLRVKRVDAIVEDRYVFAFVAGELGFEGAFRDAGAVPPANRVFIAFSPKTAESAELAKELSTGIIRIRKSGRLAQILASYGIRDWK